MSQKSEVLFYSTDNTGETCKPLGGSAYLVWELVFENSVKQRQRETFVLYFSHEVESVRETAGHELSNGVTAVEDCTHFRAINRPLAPLS